MDRDEFRLISIYWPEYFPDEVSLCCATVLHVGVIFGENVRDG